MRFHTRLHYIPNEGGHTVFSILLYLSLTSILLLSLGTLVYELFKARTIAESQAELEYAHMQLESHLMNLLGHTESIEEPLPGQVSEELHVFTDTHEHVRISREGGILVERRDESEATPITPPTVSWDAVYFSAIHTPNTPMPIIRFEGRRTSHTPFAHTIPSANTTQVYYPYRYAH